MVVLHSDTINYIRAITCILILSYSCITDWRTRRAPHMLWEVMTTIGVLLLLIEVFSTSYDTRYQVMFYFVISYTFIYLLVNFIYYFINRYLKGAFGGADANALLALSVLYPYYPTLHLLNISLPIVAFPQSPIFTLAAFGNALVLNLVLPVTIFAYNILHVPISELKSNVIPAFLGYKMKVEDIPGKFVRPMHSYEEVDGKVVKKFRAFKYPEIDEKFGRQLVEWKKRGMIPETLWVTPKIPFLIPITLGVISALLYGDIMVQLVMFIANLI
ncbi:MAG TPA: A24 family peptidase C-terminal domain-containing protein [Methanocella sp.]|nr:A24 family peptidase C-terminal domain-containing protein [Methanocella sp.]